MDDALVAVDVVAVVEVADELGQPVQVVVVAEAVTLKI